MSAVHNSGACSRKVAAGSPLATPPAILQKRKTAPDRTVNSGIDDTGANHLPSSGALPANLRFSTIASSPASTQLLNRNAESRFKMLRRHSTLMSNGIMCNLLKTIKSGAAHSALPWGAPRATNSSNFDGPAAKRMRSLGGVMPRHQASSNSVSTNRSSPVISGPSGPKNQETFPRITMSKSLDMQPPLGVSSAS